MDKHIIVAVHVTNRATHADEVQRILTEFGCSIRTRIGLHEASQKICSPNGLILLEVVDDPKSVDAMIAKLRTVTGVEVKQIVFDHP